MRPFLSFLLLLLATNLRAQTWQWTRHIGGPGEDHASVSAVDENGDFYVLVNYARTNANGPYNNCFIDGDTVFGRADAFLAKYTSNGTLLWLRNCNSNPNGSIGFSDLAIDTVEQAVYIAGSYRYDCVLDTCSLSTSFSAGFLSKWTYGGTCLWARNIATCPQDLVGSTCGLSTVAFDPAGRVIMGGGGAPYWPTTVEGEPFPPASYIVACDLDGPPFGHVCWRRERARANCSNP